MLNLRRSGDRRTQSMYPLRLNHPALRQRWASTTIMSAGVLSVICKECLVTSSRLERNELPFRDKQSSRNYGRYCPHDGNHIIMTSV